MDELVAAKAPATFIMGGHWAQTHPAAAQLLGRVSYFEIGNHSYAHHHPTQLTPAEFHQEVELAQQAIAEYSGRTSRVFRFPYGEHSPQTIVKVAAGGSIIIMHANGRGVQADALPSVISYLRSRGFKLVTVSELLASK